MFSDRAPLTVRAGRGGDGCVAFRREKYVPKGGPDGGDGGDGGDVILVASASRRDLGAFRFRPHLYADRGAHGEGSGRTGRRGADAIGEVPVGTQVREVETGALIADLAHDGARVVVARGGTGGRGNKRYATPTRQAPRTAQVGLDGDERTLELRLKLLSDAALLGFPNAGKSSLLNRISNARPKIADYAFTTLEPQLGTVEADDGSQLTVADVPGLLEGASEGVGLGHEFLAHLERARALLHIVAIEAADDILADCRAALRDDPPRARAARRGPRRAAADRGAEQARPAAAGRGRGARRRVRGGGRGAGRARPTARCCATRTAPRACSASRAPRARASPRCAASCSRRSCRSRRPRPIPSASPSWPTSSSTARARTPAPGGCCATRASCASPAARSSTPSRATTRTRPRASSRSPPRSTGSGSRARCAGRAHGPATRSRSASTASPTSRRAAVEPDGRRGAGRGRGVVSIAGSRIGVFGGVFNPPHIGHLSLCQEAAWQLGLERVVLVPTGRPAHRPAPAESPELRLRLAQAAALGNPLFTVSRLEIDRSGAVVHGRHAARADEPLPGREPAPADRRRPARRARALARGRVDPPARADRGGAAARHRRRARRPGQPRLGRDAADRRLVLARPRARAARAVRSATSCPTRCVS